MKSKFNDINVAEPMIENYLKRHKKANPSRIYKYLRKRENLSLIGCYSLLWEIVNALRQKNIKFSRFQLLYAMNRSEELKYFSRYDKSTLLEELLFVSPLQIKRHKNQPKPAKNIKRYDYVTKK